MKSLIECCEHLGIRCCLTPRGEHRLLRLHHRSFQGSQFCKSRIDRGLRSIHRLCQRFEGGRLFLNRRSQRRRLGDQLFGSCQKFLRSIGRAGQGPGELSYPYDVKVDADGVIYVCEFGNSRIQLFDQEGRSLEILGGAGTGLTNLNNPWGICFDGAENLYVADALNHRVVKYIRRSGDKRTGGST